MREITERVVEGWPVGRPFPIHTEMQDITLDVILRTVFGVDEGPRLTAAPATSSRRLLAARDEPARPPRPARPRRR